MLSIIAQSSGVRDKRQAATEDAEQQRGDTVVRMSISRRALQIPSPFKQMEKEKRAEEEKGIRTGSLCYGRFALWSSPACRRRDSPQAAGELAGHSEV
jgi:hypothetical protein